MTEKDQEGSLPAERDNSELLRYLSSTDFPHKKILLDPEQLKLLSEEEKIELLEYIYASDLPHKKIVLNKIFLATPLTSSFLDLLERRALSQNKPRNNDAETESDEEASFFDYSRLDTRMRLMMAVSPSQSGQEFSALSDETKAFLLASVQPNGDNNYCQLERDALIKCTRLNETVYLSLKRHIKAAGELGIKADLEREQQTAAADFIFQFSPSQFEKLDDERWLWLCSILFEHFDTDKPISEKWKRARNELFKHMPVPKELRKNHEKMAVKFVEKALQNPELIRLAKEADTKWDSYEWRVDLGSKKSFINALYAVLCETYEVNVPIVEVTSEETSDQTECSNIEEGSCTSTFVEDEKHPSKRRTCLLTFSTRIGHGLNKVLDKSLGTFLHEFGHVLDRSLIREKRINEHSVFDNPAASILEYGLVHYTKAAENHKLYRENPVEKHANWFADFMLPYYRAVMIELAEREVPGTYLKQASLLIDDMIFLGDNFKKSHFLANPDALSVENLVEMGIKIKASFKEGASPSLKQVADLSAFFKQAQPVFSQFNYVLIESNRINFGERDKREGFMSATNEYMKYKTYEAGQQIINAASGPKLPAVRNNDLPHLAV